MLATKRAFEIEVGDQIVNQFGDAATVDGVETTESGRVRLSSDGFTAEFARWHAFDVLVTKVNP